MRGWIQYYSVGKMTNFLQQLDKWLRSRIRQYIWKSWKKIKTRVTNLKRLGLSQNDAYKSANTRKGYWRTAHSETLKYTLTNEKTGTTRTYQSVQDIPVYSKCLSY